MYRQLIQQIAREASFPIDSFGADHFILTPQCITELRELSYLDQWKKAVGEGWFHIRMYDHSLFLFSEGLRASYSFLHCPLDVVSFPEFIGQMGEIDSPGARRRLQVDYDRVLETASERNSVTPIRYDYDPIGYRAGVHPVAHIHVGLGNQVRLASNRMSAVSFVLFVMRHMYPESWSKLLYRTNMRHLVKSIRSVDTRVPAEYWGELDEVELHFV